MTFAGGFFAEEIEDRVAIMFVVQIEVSFVSTRREARYKITADILMTFAGGFFAEEVEDRVAIMFVVQIEVSFVSTRRESDKPEKINISVLSGCCLQTLHCHKTFSIRW